MSKNTRGFNEGLKRLITYAEVHGWTFEISRGGHIRFNKDQRPPVFFSKTAGDHRAALNCMSVLRRYDRSL